MREESLLEPLRGLREAKVEFILVGGLAAICNGAPLITMDVDVVHSRDDANVARLLGFLERIGAIFRIQPSRRIAPNASHLTGTGHINLVTQMGNLDLLCTVGTGLGYEDLLVHSEEMDLAEGLRVRVLGLEKLIELKEQLRGPKDQAALPILRQTLAERRRGPGSTE
jgi:predicted nucleotidyltransferase